MQIDQKVTCLKRGFFWLHISWSSGEWRCSAYCQHLWYLRSVCHSQRWRDKLSQANAACTVACTITRGRKACNKCSLWLQSASHKIMKKVESISPKVTNNNYEWFLCILIIMLEVIEKYVMQKCVKKNLSLKLITSWYVCQVLKLRFRTLCVTIPSSKWWFTPVNK